VNRETTGVIRGYRQGHESDFEHLAEAYALSDLLADDDPTDRGGGKVILLLTTARA